MANPDDMSLILTKAHKLMEGAHENFKEEKLKNFIESEIISLLDRLTELKLSEETNEISQALLRVERENLQALLYTDRESNAQLRVENNNFDECQRKLEILSKDKERLVKENQALSKQLKDLQGKRMAADGVHATEQNKIKVFFEILGDMTGLLSEQVAQLKYVKLLKKRGPNLQTQKERRLRILMLLMLKPGRTELKISLKFWSTCLSRLPKFWLTFLKKRGHF